MNTDENRHTSGLVFLASRNCDTLELSASLQRVLEANGHRICGVQVLSETHVEVTSDILTLDLSVPEQDPSSDASGVDAETESPQAIMQKAGLVIEVALTQPPENGSVPTKRATQATLASLTCQMAIWLEPDFIQWLNEDTLLDTKDFVKAVARVMPRRVKRKEHAAVARPARPQQAVSPMPQMAMASATAAPVRPVHPTVSPTERPQTPRNNARFPDVDITSRRLEDEYDTRNRQVIEQTDIHELSELRTSFHDEEEELEATGIASRRNSVARLATWFLSITVGIFSLPLAAFLMIYNLFRGEDFRLSAQALSLTGLFTALNAQGATAQVMDIVNTIVG
ncbi:hypothetical protein [Thalassovita sp.]|uniref:hypothetical protein n=1 Tax=Thalassovita sp. TaxID=1979401 RepID=UPI0028826B8D|nr:hypothetical protein [Thalassovita sp.]MDF1801537.1 hypothetical protein [Thalassovita sp.]